MFLTKLKLLDYYILYNGTKSEQFVVNSSVPQGSNLGPLLFLLVINDLPRVVKHSDPFLFADDLNLSKVIHLESDIDEFQRDIDAVELWSFKNKLEFNFSKCFIVTYSLKKRTHLS